MYKIVALFGEAGSGKDTIQKALVRKYPKIFNPIISCTTRPPREGEINGVDYNFLTTEEFSQKLLNGEMLEATCFNDWAYGTEYSSLNRGKINIGVFNPCGIESLDEDKDIEALAYYITVSDKERLMRQLSRETNPNVDEIVRRYKTDKEDFIDLSFYYNVILNEDKKDFRNAIKIISSDAIKFYKND